ncbi:CocE/NonD family hydrolase C-terminal non-catalytic domain-containing protein [Streptomyces erythrochromogenes]|uniref:CocE/NonD family hydrolase C-terminal non-catalytic domain-containing protein n=1 Tax=Streptomyces erythrochromogenes TaxID=285574 RepID=UPI0036C6A8D6
MIDRVARRGAVTDRAWERVDLVREPVPAGEVVPVDIALGASSTLFRAGEQLRLVVAGRWLSPRNPLTGQFPASYRTGTRGRCTLHWGPDRSRDDGFPAFPPARPSAGPTRTCPPAAGARPGPRCRRRRRPWRTTRWPRR